MPISKIQHVTSVMWPSFLLSGIATIVCFTVFDPREIGACMGVAEVDRLGAYTVGFFLFWLLTLASSALTLYFQRPVHNPVRPIGDDDRVR